MGYSSLYEAPDSASRLVSFDADSYSHNVEVRSGDAESGASHTLPVKEFRQFFQLVAIVVGLKPDTNSKDKDKAEEEKKN